MRLFTLMVMVLATGSAPRLEAQDRQKGGTLGIHIGGDVSDQHTIKMAGGQFGINFARSLRVQFALSTILDEPGTSLFAGGALQWHLQHGAVRPFVGAGASMEYVGVELFSDTQWGWLAEGGIEVPTRNVIPFVELRLLGLNSVATQILVGFNVEVGQ